MDATGTILNQPQGTCIPMSTGIGSKNLQNERDVQRAIRNLELDLIRERLDSCRVDMNTPAPEIEPLITIGGSCVCSRGNISVVVGEAKSKKTFLSTALIASAMAFPTKHSHVFDTVENNLSLQVAWMDTEQSIHHHPCDQNRDDDPEQDPVHPFHLRQIFPGHSTAPFTLRFKSHLRKYITGKKKVKQTPSDCKKRLAANSFYKNVKDVFVYHSYHIIRQ